MEAEASPGEVPEATAPLQQPECSDDAAMEIIAEVIEHVGAISRATALASAVLRGVSVRVVQELYDIVAMVTVASSASFDSTADAPPTAFDHRDAGPSPLVRAVRRTLDYCAQHPAGLRKAVATASIDGDGHICGETEIAATLASLPLFLAPDHVRFIASHAQGMTVTAADLAKVCTRAFKAASKLPRTSALVTSTVCFAWPAEPPIYPVDVHMPHEVPARPQPPSPEAKHSTVRSTFVGRGVRYNVAAGIVSTKLAIEDVDVRLDAKADESDSTTFSNIFSLGTPRQLSPRELARRRDILAYLEAVEVAKQHDEMVARKKKELLERPVADGGHVTVAVPLRNQPLQLSLELPYAIGTPPEPPIALQRSPSKPLHKGRRPSQLEPSPAKPSECKAPDAVLPPGEPLPLFHLPHIDTGRLEVGVKVVYPGKKIKAGSKRIPSRNSRLKPPEPTSLPRLPLSPIKPPRPPGSPAAPPVALPPASTSPIKVNQVRHQHGTHGRVRGRPPARPRFNFSEAITRTLHETPEADVDDLS
ncbi:hypothetical protein ACHHYP_03768 [Achlya hypogyna]|uniref:Uncharacterized protein n=1 Tax=Achlya hypogyna TaxID=1202772 RepID=A0A1V9ZPQ2_ACHHY|nr:hypothetical protein ACHHYP_03768 [Achlya hypogyna]